MSGRGNSSERLDSLFEVMSHPLRRRILRRLGDGDPSNGRALVPEEIADQDDLESLKIALYHNHLPKLEEAGYIEWNRDAWEVGPGPRFEEVEPVIELVRDYQSEFATGQVELG